MTEAIPPLMGMMYSERSAGSGAIVFAKCTLKETLSLEGPKSRLLGALEHGGVDFGAVVEARRDIGYDKWFMLETGGREGHFLEDTRSNVSFVRRHSA